MDSGAYSNLSADTEKKELSSVWRLVMIISSCAFFLGMVIILSAISSLGTYIPWLNIVVISFAPVMALRYAVLKEIDPRDDFFRFICFIFATALTCYCFFEFISTAKMSSGVSQIAASAAGYFFAFAGNAGVTASLFLA